MITRRTRRVLSALLTAGALVVVTAGPARAQSDDELVGTQYPSGLSLAETLLIFVGIPALIFGVVAALVFATAGNREPRLREGQGQGWWAEPEYFSAEGAASADAAPAITQGEPAASDDETGGSSARW